jgi:methyl-accepting chemotaxis protein
MSVKDNSNKVHTGLLLKLSGTASGLVLLAIAVFAVASISSMEKSSLETAVLMGNNKLKGDAVHFAYMLSEQYGRISLRNGDLVGERGGSLAYQYGILDRVSSDLAVEATIFVKDNNDYRRISTSIIDETGQRVVDTYLGAGSAAFASVEAGESYNGRAVILGNEYLTEYQPIFAADNKEVIGILFIGIEMSEITNLIEQNNIAQIKQTIIMAVIILLFSIILNVLSSTFMLLRPIRSLVSMLKEIAEGEGDLTKKLEVSSHDEIGDVACYFNQTLEKIKNLVINIKTQAMALSQTSQPLVDQMTQTASAINQITFSVKAVKDRVINQSASVSETNATMEQITLNIDKLNVQVEKQTASVAQSSSAIEQMLANVRSVTQTLIKNTENVTELSSASEVGRSGLQEVSTDIQEISSASEGLMEINGVMQNIASQTNLLSMNAAIEAAHAGEAGKGFAVVADEIRKLAESSSEQSKTISSVLKNIKGSIDKMGRSTENVLNRFEAIDTSVKTVAEQEQHIRNAMEEQGEGSQQILESVTLVNEITQNVRGGTQEMLEGSREVIRESKNLEVVTQDISAGMNEMVTGADQINVAMHRVNELCLQNNASIEDLLKQVSRFKVE